MKRLFLLRHAKSSHEGPEVTDFERGLTQRGQGAARLMGEHMATQGWLPEQVLCSAARRAQETLEGLWQNWAAQPPVRVEGDLYGTGARELRERLQRLPEATDSVLLVGHNPAIQQLALDLAGSGEVEAYAAMRAKFPTAALAVLEVGPWHELYPGGAALVAFVRPKDLASAG